MATQAAIDNLSAKDNPSAKWSHHIWSTQAVSDAVTKSTKMITLASAKGEAEVFIHKELLCFFSPYYFAALNGNFLEAQKDRFEVHLSSEQLKCFVAWIYTGKLSEPRSWVCDIRLFIFADRVNIIALRRDILRGFSESDEVLPDYGAVLLMLKNITQHSPLYKWVLDVYIAHWTPEVANGDSSLFDSYKDPDNLLANFIYQNMKGIAIRDNFQDLDDFDDCSCCNKVCEYHEHPSKEEWEATCGRLEDSKMPASLECPREAKSQNKGKGMHHNDLD